MDGKQRYRLLTPGPLTTSEGVKEAMQVDMSTWDVDYNEVVQTIRRSLVALAVPKPAERELYTSVLLQGSGTFSVEGLIGSVVPADGTLLVIDNGAYGARIGQIADRLSIRRVTMQLGELGPVRPEEVARVLADNPEITHVALVHCETTTGRMNPAEEVSRVCEQAGACLLLDAMSSFGGVPLDQAGWGVPFLVSSANKCIQGVPGFGFIVANRRALEASRGRARSLALDVVDQWDGMEAGAGKWRYTSPTHVVLAFAQALKELELEGGVQARNKRYQANYRATVAGLKALGIEPLLQEAERGPIITSFHMPQGVSFPQLYGALKQRGFLIYPGKITEAETFRVGHIGDLDTQDMDELVEAFSESLNGTA